MQIIKGGYSFVEFDSSASFTTPNRIEKLLKAGTGFTPKTLTEDFADNLPASVMKEIAIAIRSADVNDAAGSPYALLRTAEDARTPEYFRFVRLVAETLAVENCDDAWNESVAANITSDTTSSGIKEGAAAARFTSGAIIPADTILATEVISKDLTLHKAISFWIKPSVAKAAGDLLLLLDNSVNCGSPIESLKLPALSAGVWTKCYLVLSTPSALGALISIGLKAHVSLGSGEVITIDDVNGAEGFVSVINGVVPHVEFEENEAGKHNVMKVTGSGVAETEANLLTNNF